MSELRSRDIEFKRIFQGLCGENANDFLVRFNIAANHNQWSDDEKHSHFENSLRGTALQWFNCQPYYIQWTELEVNFLS